MKKIYNILFILAIPAIFLVFTNETMYPDGSPGGKTGSPGDGANCSECHTGTPMNQEFWITSSMIGTGYSPGDQYEIVVVGVDSEANKFGFEATAEKSDNTKVGAFQADILGFTQTLNNDRAITHTTAGTFPVVDTGTFWVFKWTAPTESVGDITFYAAINAANGNNASSGDQIHLSSFTASPSVGVKDIATKNEFRMYPNPSTGILNIESKNINRKDIIEVLNLHGQVVLSEIVENENIRLDLTEQEKGIYFIRIGNYTEKLLIQ